MRSAYKFTYYNNNKPKVGDVLGKFSGQKENLLLYEMEERDLCLYSIYKHIQKNVRNGDIEICV